ncbi:uncharacterized protein LOC132742532 [Ruditapes philippinarum]|uniref:uncharacterized protein LOC132742532 n=1 Tax=Ruditapes philippinarum TaxID=129788 RepID=UPI00295B91F6|nr:uncharacterized protein LOC132742532 [Ruditapes philippinarum]
MDTLWRITLLTIVVLACQISQIFGQNYRGESEDFDDFDLSSKDSTQKRFSKFVRIGRGLSSFIRIGRQVPFEKFDLYQLANSPYGIDDDNSDTGKSAFFEMPPETFEQPSKRLSSFVRIGRNYDDGDELDDNINKRGGAFIRMGKFPSSAFLRNRGGSVNGYTAQPYYRRTGRIGHSSFIRIGKRDTSDALRRMSENENVQDTNDITQQVKSTVGYNDIDSLLKDQERRYLKIGREVEEINSEEKPDDVNDGKRYLKIGRDVVNKTNEIEADGQSVHDPENEGTDRVFDKRLSNFVRIGKGSSDRLDKPPEKRFSKFVRIGKNYNTVPNKRRMSSFVRIGRQNNQLDNFPKRRISSFVRIGKKSSDKDDSDDQQETNLYAENWSPTEDDYDTTNKRISSFVRIGKSQEQLDDDINKRYSSFVRIGKSGNSLENELAKRYSSFVRIGRNYPNLKNEFDKRLSSFIRVGKNNAGTNSEDFNKRISSFVRIGKNSPSLIGRADKRYSSFVRIGKGADDFDPTTHKRLSSFIRVGKRATDTSANTD